MSKFEDRIKELEGILDEEVGHGKYTLDTKACPFCESLRILQVDDISDDPNDPMWSVNCVACGGEGPPGSSKKMAVDRWNSRSKAAMAETNPDKV